MALILDGTAGLQNNATDLSYTGTLTGGTGVVNLGSGQVYKDASGNVGIGTSSPSSKLAVLGSDGTGFTGVTSTNSNTNVGIAGVQFGSDPTYVKSAIGLVRSNANGVGSLVFYNDSNTDAANWSTGDEKMRIDSSGNLLVGTTTSTAKFTLAGNMFGTFDGSAVNGINLKTTLASTGSGFISFINSGSTTCGIITQNGSTTVSYATSSDYRLKNNVTPMTGALATIAQLKPVTYKWKIDGSDGQGFIAHELAEVVPDCVTGEKDAVETYMDENGVEQTRPKYQGIDTSFLVATLTAAIQELKAIIDTQATRITALEAANV